MGKVIFTTSTLHYFDQLVYALFENNYFSYEESAQDYVEKLISFIIDDIHTFPKRNTPEKLHHLGSFYIFYNANQRTTWYIFFEKKNHDYLITSILNNHCEEARYITSTF